MSNPPNIRRREFLQTASASAATVAVAASQATADGRPKRRPNVVFLLADQWRAQATGYAGDPNLETPHLDQMASLFAMPTSALLPPANEDIALLITGRAA